MQFFSGALRANYAPVYNVIISEGMYIQCFARLAPGGKVLGMEPTAEGYGGEEKFVSLKHEYNSYQQAQSWEDNPSVSLSLKQGSHKVWKSWKTWKTTEKSSMHGKIMEFEKT